MAVILLAIAAPDLGASKGPGPRPPTKESPPHIHVFNDMCDMCMPLSHFSKENFL